MNKIVLVFVIILSGCCNKTQSNIPEYSKASYIENKYSESISHLIKVAEFKLEPDNAEVVKSVNLPEIIGAFVINGYSETGAGMSMIKDYSEKYLKSSKIGSIGPLVPPEINKPNILIWGGNVLEYHKKIIVNGETKGFKLEFDLDILRKQWEQKQ